MRFASFFAGTAILVSAFGCGNAPTEDAPVARTSAAEPVAMRPDGPEAAVHQFLEAIRLGNDEAASQMLTPMAKAKTAEYDLTVAPPGSDTASFKVGEVELIGDEGAHVASFWTDVDMNGEKHTDTIVWMVRKEPQGWRIAGMATRVVENQPPVILNFEDPEDMLAKQQAIEEQLSGGSEQPRPLDTAPAETANRLRGENSAPPLR
jgi:hypothetical protein